MYSRCCRNREERAPNYSCLRDGFAVQVWIDKDGEGKYCKQANIHLVNDLTLYYVQSWGYHND